MPASPGPQDHRTIRPPDHADHLGSTSLVTNATGGEVGRQRYFPYGQGRPGDASLPTDYRFTGQRHEGTIGLYDYGARFYDPLLGRFVSADTVVPEPGNPQALNRFSYCLNNPLRYTDPSGHLVEASVSGEPVPYEPPPLPPVWLIVENQLDEVLRHLPANVGGNKQKKWDLIRYGGPLIRTRVSVKVSSVVRTGNPNTHVYIEPERWKFTFPVGAGKYYVQLQEDLRVAHGMSVEKAYQYPGGEIVKLKLASSVSHPMIGTGLGVDSQTTAVFEWNKDGRRIQKAASLSLQFEVNNFELALAALETIYILYGAPQGNPQPQYCY